MATYTYSLSADFTDICLKTLTEEITSAGSGVTTGLLHISVGLSAQDDNVDIVFGSVLSGAEQTALDSIVATHVGTPCPETGDPYMRIDGTTAFTAPISGVPPVMGNQIALLSTTEETSANALAQATSYIDTQVASVSGALGDLATVQVVRTTNLNINTGDWVDVPFDITDIENNPSIIEHDDVNTDRINIKEDGMYVLQYNASLDLAGEAGDDDFALRVIKNDTTECSGSRLQLNDSGDMHTHSGTCIAELSNGDFVTFQINNNVTTALLMAGASFKVARMRGTRGADGPPGSGSTLIVKDEGINVTGTPHAALDFIGNLVTVTAATSALATVTISGGVDDFLDLSDTPSSYSGKGTQLVRVNVAENALEFAPSGTGGGGGTFGSEFQQAVSSGISSTSSTSYQQKLRLTTPSLPAGTYRIGWNYEIDGNSDNSRVRVELNDTDELAYNKYDSSIDGYIQLGGFAYRSISGVNTIDIDYSMISTGTIDIRRARLEFWRVS